jgi:hypothetical protein
MKLQTLRFCNAVDIRVADRNIKRRQNFDFFCYIYNNGANEMKTILSIALILLLVVIIFEIDGFLFIAYLLGFFLLVVMIMVGVVLVIAIPTLIAVGIIWLIFKLLF